MIKSLFAFVTLIAMTAVALAQGQQQVQRPFGPVIMAYLTNLSEELNELEFQIEHQEISRSDYTRTKQRLRLQQQYVERLAANSSEDTIPDLQILTANELTTMLGLDEGKIQKLQVGDQVSGKWQIIGIEKTGERFIILKRTRQTGDRQSRPKINPLDVIEIITVYEPDPEELRPPPPATSKPISAAPLPPEPAREVVRIPRPKISALFMPPYTPKARQKRVEGKVILSALFTRDGHLKDLTLENKIGYGLDENALNAAKLITFEPATLDGQAVDVRAQITYFFTLSHTTASIQPISFSKGGQP
jgi:TonB family protein